MVAMSTLACYVKKHFTSFSSRYEAYISLIMCPITSLTEPELCHSFTKYEHMDKLYSGKNNQINEEQYDKCIF